MGEHPSFSKERAIKETPQPSKVSELNLFLDLDNNLFLNQQQSLLHFRSNESWQNNKEQQATFKRVKGILSMPNLMVHYDKNKPLVLACDVVSGPMSLLIKQKDQLHNIYASCSLNITE